MNISRLHALALGAALLATPAWPASLDPKACDPRASAQSQLGVLVQPAQVAQGLSGVIQTTDDDELWVSSDELAAARAAELQAQEHAERARASAVELETHAVELQQHAAEMAQRAYAEQGRARARAESDADKAELDAEQRSANARTFRRESPGRAANADRSLEERVARLEALANERFPGRDRADSGTLSLEARVAELETLLLGNARQPAPRERARASVPSPFVEQRVPGRILTPRVYSYDTQRGALRELQPGASGGTFSRTPAEGGGGRWEFAPRAQPRRERAAPAPAPAVPAVPAVPAAPAEPRDTQRAEVEHRMTELREQLAKLREQMNGMRAELEALPRREE